MKARPDGRAFVVDDHRRLWLRAVAAGNPWEGCYPARSSSPVPPVPRARSAILAVSP